MSRLLSTTRAAENAAIRLTVRGEFPRKGSNHLDFDDEISGPAEGYIDVQGLSAAQKSRKKLDVFVSRTPANRRESSVEGTEKIVRALPTMVFGKPNLLAIDVLTSLGD